MGNNTNDFWLDLIVDYCEATGTKETGWELSALVDWAQETGKWTPDSSMISAIGIGQCKRAMKHAGDVTGPRGHKIRQFISAQIRQKDLWVHIDDASHDFVVAYVQQQAKRISDDHASLVAFVEWYNANKLGDGQLQLRLDFDWRGKGGAAA